MRYYGGTVHAFLLNNNNGDKERIIRDLTEAARPNIIPPNTNVNEDVINGATVIVITWLRMRTSDDNENMVIY